MEIISILVLIVIAMWAGWHIRGIVMLAAISENPERVIKMLKEIQRINETESVEDILGAVEIKPEQVNGYWYAYSADNSQFLGQGPTLEDALKMVADRFPEKKFWCKEPNNFSQST